MFVGIDLEWIVSLAVFLAASFGQKLSMLPSLTSNCVRDASQLPSVLLSLKIRR